MVTKSNSGYWSFAVDGFVFLDIKGNRYTMVRGLENPCLLTSLWNWLGPLWRVDELLYLSLLVLSKLLLPQLYFRIRAFVCAYACVCVWARARARYMCVRLHVGTGIAAKRDITRTVYRASVCAYENGGTRNRRLYLTLEQISLIVRYSLTAIIRLG